MKIKSGLLNAALLSVAGLLIGSSNTLASDPVGVYAVVDKVVLEPNDQKPERIVIQGAFALAEGRGDTYAPAKRGTMYFTAKAGQEEVVRKEWADLKSVAGTDQIVAFGSRYASQGTIHPGDAKPKKPDEYATGVGVTKISADRDYPPIKDLTALKKGSAEKSKGAPAK